MDDDNDWSVGNNWSVGLNAPSKSGHNAHVVLQRDGPKTAHRSQINVLISVPADSVVVSEGVDPML